MMIAEMVTSTSLIVNSISSRATGAVAEYVEVQCRQSNKHLQESVCFGLYASGVFDQLLESYEQFRMPNWDGYGAEPVSEDTYRYAYRFLESLPWGTPAPSVGAEADGHLTLEWYRSPRRTLSVSISPDGYLHYAALLGIRKAYGSEPFFGEDPTVIQNLIRQVYSA